MSDRVATEILIGGTLPHALVPAFLQTADADGASVEFGEHATMTPEELRAAVTSTRGPLRLVDTEHEPGGFEQLEAFCRTHRLAYDRRQEAKYDADGVLVKWRPGMQTPWETFASQDGIPLIHHATITRIARRLARRELPVPDAVLQLRRLAGAHIRRVPPLVITRRPHRCSPSARTS